MCLIQAIVHKDKKKYGYVYIYIHIYICTHHSEILYEVTNCMKPVAYPRQDCSGLRQFAQAGFG